LVIIDDSGDDPLVDFLFEVGGNEFISLAGELQKDEEDDALPSPPILPF
jgi:hypothetical protein